MQKKTVLIVLLLAVMITMTRCSGPNPAPSPTAMPTVGPETDFPHIDLGEGLYLRQIREDVFVVTHAFPWPANSLIVEMENKDMVLAGTPYTPEAMQIVLDWIAERFGKRNITAINPGFHVDNLGGNGALAAQGIPVYGSDLTADLLEERGEQTRQQILRMLAGPGNETYHRAHSAIPYIPPSRLFPITEGLTLDFNGEEVIVYYPGPSQAPDKVAIYFPHLRILFGSCMILGGDQIGNTADADLAAWPQAVEKLKRFDAAFVIPGHGDRLDPGLIDHTMELLTAGS